MAAAQLTMSCIGRPFSLGALYDKRNDSIITGLKVLTRQQMEGMIQQQSIPSMDCEFINETSLSEMTKHLDVSGNLSLSLLSGSITANGSGKYITDTKETKEKDKVTYKVEVKTMFEELHMPPNFRLSDIEKFPGATHIVTGIQFGGTAFFTFERNKEDSTSKDNAGGNLKAQIAKFASLTSLSASAKFDMKSGNKELMQKIKVTYKGDFHLVSPPTNLTEALSCIQSIKAEVGKSPMTVTLLPLSLITDEKVPPVPVPLSKQCQDRAIGCYESVNSAIATLDNVLESLVPTLWTRVVKQLEMDARDLREFKTSLDEAVKEGLQNQQPQRTLEQTKNLEAAMVNFDSKYGGGKLQQWIDAVSESSKVLLVILEKFQQLEVVEIITSQSQKVRFMMESMTAKDEQLLISVSCPVNSFSFSHFSEAGKLELWKSPTQEAAFYSEFMSLEQSLDIHRSSSRAAVQQSESVDEGLSITHKKRIGSDWK